MNYMALVTGHKYRKKKQPPICRQRHLQRTIVTIYHKGFIYWPWILRFIASIKHDVIATVSGMCVPTDALKINASVKLLFALGQCSSRKRWALVYDAFPMTLPATPMTMSKGYS
jgi:hypothetical protein